jgi:peptide methionine sulfoxide reductase msrA/msrB
MLTPPPLNPEEEHVIVHKGTEPPFSGQYTDNKESGLYLCRQCGAPLYRSNDKFSSHCGWPSFDSELPGKVTRLPDADGRRVEILCTSCGGHLGHVFQGERLTKKNTRHCVNSHSLLFLSYEKLITYALEHPDLYDVVYVAGGCFWGVEHQVSELPGVLATRVGYTGGKTEKPTYQTVCSHTTGHAETVEAIVYLKELPLDAFYHHFLHLHDPTQLNRQGPDIGDQYRSAIFYRIEHQKEIAYQEIEGFKNRGIDVVTTLEPLKQFWPAEIEHQQYHKKHHFP